VVLVFIVSLYGYRMKSFDRSSPQTPQQVRGDSGVILGKLYLRHDGVGGVWVGVSMCDLFIYFRF